MLNFPKIRVALWTVWQKHKGYDLIQNSRQIPYTTVRLIKSSKSIDRKTLDVTVSYEKLTKDFSKSERPETRETLKVCYYKFFDNEKNLIDTKKHKKYTKTQSDGKITNDIEKGKISPKILKARNLKSINRKSISRIEYVPDMTYAAMGKISQKRVTIRESYAEKEYKKFLENQAFEHNVNYKPFNFWRILLKNLHNSQ